MKQFILSALTALVYCLCALFPPQPLTRATADDAATTPVVGGYACVLTNDVFFYETPAAHRGLFLLPETYFVKLLEVDETFCKIEYLYDDSNVKKLVGYAQTDQLAFVDYVPRRPYLYKLFDVHYTLDSTLPSDGFLNQITLTCAYYGDYKVGSETYCYVLRGDQFGYIPKPADLTLERNTEYEENLSPPIAETPPDEPQPQETNAAQIGILIALCLLVPILAALILKPPKRPPYLDQE